MNTEDPIQGPYKPALRKGGMFRYYVTHGRGENGFLTKEESVEFAADLNAAWIEGQRSGWVPVSEKANDGEFYQVCSTHGVMLVAHEYINGHWRAYGRPVFEDDGYITHYKPLPQPPNP